MDEDLASQSADPRSVDQDAYSESRFGARSTTTLVRGLESTRLIFMGDNFQQTRSDHDVFFDCRDTAEDSPQEGRSASSRCKMDDPAAFREALVRAANDTQVLLRNFDKAGGGWNKPCGVTLELTARLVDPKKSRAGCPLHGKPVTVQMPLEFNPQGGQRIGPCQKKHSSGGRHRKESVCQCRSQQGMHSASRSPKPSTGKSTSEQFRACESQQLSGVTISDFMGSCGDSTSQYFRCTPGICGQRFDPNAREVISICYLPVPEPEPEPQAPTPPPPEESVEELQPETDHLQIYGPEPEPESQSAESSEEESEELLSSEESVEQLGPPPQEPPKGSKRYYLALPQNKEFSNCSPCRFDPSPIMDEDGNVFCPGNCGCCMCPWKKRSFSLNQEHINVKVCRCVQRGTIFTKFEDREVCSQTSNFDFCPCREKAEAKFLELYHQEMWSRPDITRGREIRLTEIKELAVPPNFSNE